MKKKPFLSPSQIWSHNRTIWKHVEEEIWWKIIKQIKNQNTVDIFRMDIIDQISDNVKEIEVQNEKGES